MKIGNRIIELEFINSYRKNAIPYIETTNTNKFGIGFEKNRKTLTNKIVNIYYLRLSFLKFRLIFKTYKVKRGIQFYIRKRRFQIHANNIFSKEDRKSGMFKELGLSV